MRRNLSSAEWGVWGFGGEGENRAKARRAQRGKEFRVWRGGTVFLGRQVAKFQSADVSAQSKGGRRETLFSPTVSNLAGWLLIRGVGID